MKCLNFYQNVKHFNLYGNMEYLNLNGNVEYTNLFGFKEYLALHWEYGIKKLGKGFRIIEFIRGLR